MPSKSRDEWDVLVAEYKQSGLTQVAFAKKHEVTVKALRYWRKKLDQRNGPTGFIPIVVRSKPEPSTPEPLTWNSQPIIEAEFGGLTLRFPAGTDSRYVARLLAEVPTC